MLFSLLVGFLYPSLIRENIIFQKTNEITTTRSRWLVAFVIDLAPYQKLINKLNEHLTEASKDISEEVLRYWQKRKPDKYLRFENTLRVVKYEVQNLNQTQAFLLSELEDIKSLHFTIRTKRNKRALLPIVGKALSFLFGTLSESDIESIKNNINTLAKNQKHITHVLKESLSVIKVSQGQIKQNRRSINQLINSFGELRNFSIVLSENVQHLDYFVRLYADFDRSLSDIHEMIGIARDYLQHLKLQLNMLSLGHLSPSVIPPGEFRRLLLNVRSKLPSQFRFPIDPERDLWTLYKTLTCTTLIENEKLFVVVSIPLLDTFGQLELYQVHNLAVSLNHNGDNQDITMFAQYQLETKDLAINNKRTQYILLTSKEAEICSSNQNKYCSIRSPVYSVTSSKLCIIKIFMGDENGINKFCKTIVNPNVILPLAEYLTDGQWAVVTLSPLKFEILCQSPGNLSRNSITVKPPLDIVTLPMSCSAYSGHITLVPFYHQESVYNLSTNLQIFLANYHFIRVKIWKPFVHIFPDFNKIKLPPKLQEIKEIPMGALIDELNQVNLKLEPMSGTSIWTYISIILIILAVFIIICFCCRKRFQNCYKICKNMRLAKSGKRDAGLSEPTSVRQPNIPVLQMVEIPEKAGDGVNVHRDEDKTTSDPPVKEPHFEVRQLYPRLG